MQQLSPHQHADSSLKTKIATGLLLGFSGLWFALYLARTFSTRVAYLVIVASFLFALFVTISKGKNRTLSDILLTVALCLTCIADIFMGFLQERQWCVETGVTIFALVQAVYSARMSATRNGRAAFWDKRFRMGLWMRGIIIAMALILTAVLFWDRPIFRSHTYLLIITAVYIANALVNVIYGIIYAPHNPLVPVGLMLLLACDVFLGMAFLGAPVAKGYLEHVSISWIFYLPSQPILALSILTDKR